MPKIKVVGGDSSSKNIMGSQGKPAPVKAEHYTNRPTKKTTFEQGTAPRKASGRGNPPNHSMKGRK